MKRALLAVETATDVCGVALHDGARVIFSSHLRQRQMHARALAPLIEQALAWLPGGWEALGAVAVSAGPGSYTGLRIGVSTAKGLCTARDLDLVAVPSLEALATQALPFTADGDAIGATFNSRKGEVYVAWFTRQGDDLLSLQPPAALTLEAAASEAPLATARWLVGEGATALAAALPSGLNVLPDTLTPNASSVARLGALRWNRGETESVADFEPFYLKPFQLREAVPTT